MYGINVHTHYAALKNVYGRKVFWLPTMVYTCANSSDKVMEERKLHVIPKVGMGVRLSYRGCRRRYAVNVHNKMVRYSSALSSSPGREERTIELRLNLERYHGK